MWLLSPLTWALLAGVCGLLAWRVRHRWRWLWRVCASALILSVLAMTPLLANALLWRLERLARPDAACGADPPDTVVALAGGIDQLPQGNADFGVLGLASRRRLDSAVAYWRTVPGRTLIITGGPARPGLPAESELLAAYATTLGVPAAAMRLETEATNTWQNAQRVAHMHPAVAPRVALATSALHMARAQLAFRAAGFSVCPISSDVRFTPNDLPEALLPRSGALAKSEAAIHELVGLISYRLRALRTAPGDSN